MELVLYATSQYPFIYGYSGLWQACQMPNLCGQSEQEAAVLHSYHVRISLYSKVGNLNL